jgi:pimeloyl-ACP methyl ester carboxylesterase
MKTNYWLAIGLALVVSVALQNLALAAGPVDGPDQDGGRRVGLTSTAVECLVVNAGTLDSASATVHLEWEGQVDEAFLVLSAAGSRGEHSIYVNGQRVGRAPFHPGGQPCQAGPSVGIPLPTGVLVSGDNVVAFTNDADVSDGWTAAEVYLEVHGDLRLPSPTPPEVAPDISDAGIGATVAEIGSVPLVSTYDGYYPHYVWYQVPDDPVSDPTPLLVVIHGWGGTGEVMLDFMGAALNEWGWLSAAPNMHGNYWVDGKRALAWPGAQHDIIDAVEYMMSTYNVDTSRIYITGASMGGQIATVMAAKYPDVFAAATEWKGFTDLAEWYDELIDVGKPGMAKNIRREIDPNCDPDNPVPLDCGTPAAEPFEYQRRSAMEMPQNSRLIPLRLWHNEEDVLVPIHHAYDLAGAINSWGPPLPVTVITATTVPAGTYKHDYDPDLDEMFDYLAGFTLDSQPPVSVTIRTEESKPYYWIDVAQTGGDHWSQVQASYDLADETVTATISDTQPLTLGFNLGSTPIMGRVIERPGIGLPATTYLIKGGGVYALADYTSGYLTTTLAATGQFMVTISAVEAELSANPAMILGGKAATSTITAVFRDHLNNPAPTGTAVRFSTSEGTFPNADSAYTATIQAGGQVTTTLTLTPAAHSAEIIASVESITVSTSVEVIRPDIDVRVMPDQTMIRSGHTVTFTYQVTNTGDITLTAVTLVDDNGTPGDSSDDHVICENVSLAADATETYSRSVTLNQQITMLATATGHPPLGNDVTASDWTTVRVISPAIDLVVTAHTPAIGVGELVTYTYQITNTGDVTLTGVTVVDDNGTPGDGSDDFAVCGYAALPSGPEAAKICNYSATLTQTTTHVAVVTGRDPLGLDVTDSDSTTVMVGVQMYLPIVTRNGAP